MFRKICLFLSIASCAPAYTPAYIQPIPIPNLPTAEDPGIFNQPKLESNRLFQKWTRHYDVFVDRRVNRYFHSHMTSSLSAWNHAMNGWVVFNTNLRVIDVKNHSELQYAREQQYSIIFQMYEGNDEPNTIAFTNDPGSKHIFFIHGKVTAGNIFEVINHELGHILGAKHDTHSTLMHPDLYKGNYKEFDPRTMIQVGNYLQIPLDKLNCAFSSCKF